MFQLEYRGKPIVVNHFLRIIHSFFSSKEISAPFFKLPTKSIRPRFLTAKKKILAPLFLNAAQVSHKFWKVPNEEVSGIIPWVFTIYKKSYGQ